jgi:hypothetical protein
LIYSRNQRKKAAASAMMMRRSFFAFQAAANGGAVRSASSTTFDDIKKSGLASLQSTTPRSKEKLSDERKEAGLRQKRMQSQMFEMITKALHNGKLKKRYPELYSVQQSGEIGYPIEIIDCDVAPDLRHVNVLWMPPALGDMTMKAEWWKAAEKSLEEKGMKAIQAEVARMCRRRQYSPRLRFVLIDDEIDDFGDLGLDDNNLSQVTTATKKRKKRGVEEFDFSTLDLGEDENDDDEHDENANDLSKYDKFDVEEEGEDDKKLVADDTEVKAILAEFEMMMGALKIERREQQAAAAATATARKEM